MHGIAVSPHATGVRSSSRSLCSRVASLVNRVVIVGPCGSGKTTLGRALAARIDAPFTELDALYHGPNWTTRPEFAADADRVSRASRWVLDGNYSSERDMLWSRADTVVWLDLPLWLVEWQVTRRSVSRWIRGMELWHGNREPGPLEWLDPEHPIRWAWKKHAEYRVAYAARFEDSKWAGLRRARLRSRAEVEAFLSGARAGD